MIELLSRRLVVLVAFLLAGSVTSGIAQSRIEYGVEAGPLLVRPVGTVSSINGVTPCSEVFDGEISAAPAGGLFATFVFDRRPALLRGLRLSAGYERPSLRFRSGRYRMEAFDSRGGTYPIVETEYAAEFRLGILRTALELELEPFRAFLTRVGTSIRLPLSASAEETESILSPAGATFLDRRQIREIPGTSGELTDAGIVIGATASIARRLPIGTELFMEPTIAADIGFTSLAPAWSIGSLRLGLAVGYARTVPLPIPIAEIIPVEPDRPQPESPSPFSGEIDLRLDVERVPIELRRQIVARYVPLLPVLFFEKGSPEISPRYSADAAERSEFDENRVSSSAERAHLDILDVVGSRLSRIPSANVTVTGTTSVDEEERPELARRRAEGIAAYLRKRWGIDRRRIAIRSRLDPAVASNSERAEGREENRRVELEFSDDAIYRPIQIRSVEPAADPDSLAWRVTARLSHPAARWELRIERSDALIGRIESSETDLSRIAWKLTQREREQMLVGGAIGYRLRAFDSSGRVVESGARELPLRLDTTVSVAGSADRPDNTAEFLLVTFDFDRAELTARGREELKSILERIGPTSTIAITGYTDRTGESLRNRQLAEERAARIARQMPSDRPTSVRGAAPEEAPYSGTTPEGRFLSRTVRVVITDPK
jgi:outer membrane protein OmpA-like peptidoglycan-associated protein